MRNSLDNLDSGLMTVENSIQFVEDSSEQLNQNVTDKWLILTLLPTSMEDELTNIALLVRDGLAEVRDFLDETKKSYKA